MKDYFIQIVLFLAGAVIGVVVPLLPKTTQKRIAGILAILLIATSLVWGGYVLIGTTPPSTLTATPSSTYTPIAPTSTNTPTPLMPTRTPTPIDLTPITAGNADRVKHFRKLGEHVSWVSSVAFSPDGHTLASGSADRSVRLWPVDNWATRSPSKEYTGTVTTTAIVRSVAFSPNGSMLGMGLADGTVQLWQVGDWTTPLSTLTVHTSTQYTKTLVTFSPDSETLASGTGDGDGTVRLWRVDDWFELPPLEGPRGAWILDVTFSPNGKTLAAGTGEGAVWLWRMDGMLINELEVPISEPHGPTPGPQRSVNSVWSVAFSPDGTILAAGAGDGTVWLWQVSDSSAELQGPLEGHEGRVLDVVFSMDGSVLASGSEDNTVRLWSVSAGKSLNKLNGHTADVTSVAFSPDGQTLASGSLDGTVRLWRVR